MQFAMTVGNLRNQVGFQLGLLGNTISAAGAVVKLMGSTLEKIRRRQTPIKDLHLRRVSAILDVAKG